MSNPFADPESFLDYGVRVKDVKTPVAPIGDERSGKMRKPKKEEPSPLPPGANAGFFLETFAQGYRLRDVPHRDEKYDFDWSGSLLPGDGSATPNCQVQDTWLSNSEYRTIDKVVFDIPSGPEYASTILALYRHRDTKDATQKKLLSEFKDLLAKDFGYWMMTSTCTKYTPTGKDVVEHCRSRTDRYTIDAAVAGSNAELSASMAAEANAWLGVTDIPEFKEAVKWLTGKNVTYVWRCQKHKNTAFECALVLGVVGDGFDIYADDIVIRPARGVAVRKIFSP